MDTDSQLILLAHNDHAQVCWDGATAGGQFRLGGEQAITLYVEQKRPVP